MNLAGPPTGPEPPGPPPVSLAGPAPPGPEPPGPVLVSFPPGRARPGPAPPGDWAVLVPCGPGPGPSVPVACLVDRVLTPPVPPLAAPPAAGLPPAGPVVAVRAGTAPWLRLAALDVPPTFGWPLLREAYCSLF